MFILFSVYRMTKIAVILRRTVRIYTYFTTDQPYTAEGIPSVRDAFGKKSDKRRQLRFTQRT
ncbi:MAG: hypothetical protein J6K28_00735 [Alistipes sp.]|nr:hypothetical protein [Alistipes sp.]